MAARGTATGLTVLWVAGVLWGCSRPPEGQGPQFADHPAHQQAAEYHLAVHPLHNPVKLIQAYQPLIEYLNARVDGARFNVEASRDYAAFEAKYRARKTAFLLPNPWQTVEAIGHGYHVIAMAGDADDFRGVFVVRRDSALQRPQDLRGKRVSYPSPTALAACIMPQQFLHAHGIDVNRDIVNAYVGSQESSIMNAFLRLSDAGATWPPPWRAFQREHPQEASELKVIWQTEPLINNSVMVRDDVPPALSARVRQLLLELDRSPDGRRILDAMETARFTAAEDDDYGVVRRYVDRFEHDVRPIDAP